MAEFDAETFMASLKLATGERPSLTRGKSRLWHFRSLNRSDFVIYIYRLILGREADGSGLETYSPCATTLIGKSKIACSLLCSRENFNNLTRNKNILEYLNPLSRKFDCNKFMDSVKLSAGRGYARRSRARMLADLLKLNGPKFVQGAYMLILDRSADNKGLSMYGPKSYTGLGRLRIILSLLRSPERKGRRFGTNSY